MAEERIVKHPHDYDGIVELDNELPRWWLGIFWVTITFAVFYAVYYHGLHPEKLPEGGYQAEVAQNRRQLRERAAQAPEEPTTEAQLAALYGAGGWQASAKADYDTFCQPCHAVDGGGGIGPNFTDDYYLHGGRLTDIQHVITEGVPAKGMVPWKGTLKSEQIRNLSFYIKSMRGTSAAAPKEPQGDRVDEAGAILP